MSTRSPEIDPAAPGPNSGIKTGIDSAGPPADPLSKLHKMSTTAGVASQQYVAVNSTAVVAALLGVASGLTLFSTLLLVIPVAGLVMAIVAWRQIGDSNGTETGKPVAALGLLLSLLIGGGVLAKELTESARNRANARLMDDTATKLCDAIKANQFTAAYDLFSANFRARIAFPQFEARLRAMQAPRGNGRIRTMKWNGVTPVYEKYSGGAEVYGVISAVVVFDAGEGRFTFVYRKVDAGWQLDNVVEMFPAEKQPK